MSERADALLAWYERVRRPLPWRATRDPYALLVSEVMLQQTQAARVVPYYEAFLARFPDPAALAAAPARDVLAAWSGLGYNRRALALQAAAAVVAEQGWPEDLHDAARRRPVHRGGGGLVRVGRPARRRRRQRPARDRALGRPRAHAAPARRARRRACSRRAGAAAWNQAMMELGATVCTARAARCDACPVAAWCASAGAPVAAARAAGPRRPRFEDTDRYARGRIVAALLEGAPLPALEAERLERALAGLARDGLIVRDAAGAPALP